MCDNVCETMEDKTMSMAWETTTEDIEQVLENEGFDGNIIDEFLDNLHSNIDHERVEEAALYGDEMEEQTDYAYSNIRDQLVEQEVL